MWAACLGKQGCHSWHVTLITHCLLVPWGLERALCFWLLLASPQVQPTPTKLRSTCKNWNRHRAWKSTTRMKSEKKKNLSLNVKPVQVSNLYETAGVAVLHYLLEQAGSIFCARLPPVWTRGSVKAWQFLETGILLSHSKLAAKCRQWEVWGICFKARGTIHWNIIFTNLDSYLGLDTTIITSSELSVLFEESGPTWISKLPSSIKDWVILIVCDDQVGAAWGEAADILPNTGQPVSHLSQVPNLLGAIEFTGFSRHSTGQEALPA